MEHLLLTVFEHKYLQKHKLSLEADYNIKINLPEVDKNAVFCSSDVIFASIHGEEKKIEIVKTLMKQRTAKDKCVAVITLSDSDTPVLSEQGQKRVKKKKRKKLSSATSPTTTANNAGAPSPNLPSSADNIELPVGEASSSLPPAEVFIPLSNGRKRFRTKKQRANKRARLHQQLQSRSPICRRLRSRDPVYQQLQSREPVCQQLQSREPVCQQLQSRDPVCQQLQSREPVCQQLQSRDPVCQQLQSRDPVCQQLQFRDLVYQQIQSADPVCQQLQSADPVCQQLQKDDDSIILIEDDAETSLSVNEVSANDSIILLEERSFVPPVLPTVVVPRPLPTRNLRPIVIDGNNVAREHGRSDNTYSCRGIQLAVDFFLQRGHTQVTAFAPNFRRYKVHGPIPTTRPEILEELYKNQRMAFTPSRNLNGKRLTCYDDRFIVELASTTEGVILSNDNYRDLVGESDAFRKTIEERLLMFCFVGDKLMIPQDPLGRNGPNLDTYLSLPPAPPEGSTSAGIPLVP